ncbi:MAG: TetR/AcrR family transcriptional regulator [Sphingobacteriales bacterium]|nr:TetR/AcrR family transcriptional regulator [Sphingobacteriales bacterium]
MTIANRKQREKEEMRSLILDAARTIFLEKGYEQASIRAIAEKIEYSPGTIYLYFKDKDEIFHALHEEGFSRMLKKMQPLQHVQDPFERLKAMGAVYLDFAQNNRDFYDLMFILQAPIKHEIDMEDWKMGHQTLDYLKNILRECQEQGRFRGRDINYLSFTIWSMVHGMSALYCRDRCKAYHDVNLEPKELMENGYKIFISALEKF